MESLLLLHSIHYNKPLPFLDIAKCKMHSCILLFLDDTALTKETSTYLHLHINSLPFWKNKKDVLLNIHNLLMSVQTLKKP